MQKVLVFIAYGYFRLHRHYIKALGELYLEHKTKTFFFCETLQKEDVHKVESLKKLGINIFSYKNPRDLENMIHATTNNFQVVYIDTQQEDLVYITHMFKSVYKKKISYDPLLFTSKEKQRYYIEKNAPEISVRWKKIDIYNYDYTSLKQYLGSPFLVKPAQDSGSSLVSLIHSEKDLEKYKHNSQNKKEFLAEEFLDGTLCNIDYYVDSRGNISYTPPYVTHTAKTIGIDDFFIYSWGPEDDMREVVDYASLQTFIEQTVAACHIKNSFVCHEFIVSKDTKKIRTVELNGRIGMGTILYLEHAYKINPYNFLFQQQTNIASKREKYFHYYRVFPKKTGVLKSYNYELIQKMKELPSCVFLEIFPDRFEGQKIGLSKDGFWRVGLIAFAHKNKEQFRKDCDFLEDNYHNILIME